MNWPWINKSNFRIFEKLFQNKILLLKIPCQFVNLFVTSLSHELAKKN